MSEKNYLSLGNGISGGGGTGGGDEMLDTSTGVTSSVIERTAYANFAVTLRELIADLEYVEDIRKKSANYFNNIQLGNEGLLAMARSSAMAAEIDDDPTGKNDCITAAAILAYGDLEAKKKVIGDMPSTEEALRG